MTHFEKIGEQRLTNANNKTEAHTLYEQSCTICTLKGRHAECRYCAIESAYKLVIAYFDDKKKTK